MLTQKKCLNFNLSSAPTMPIEFKALFNSNNNNNKKAQTYLFWLWNCRLMTSKLVPEIFLPSTECTWKVHTKEHSRCLHKNAHSHNLQSFYGSKYRNCQVKWKSIKKKCPRLLLMPFFCGWCRSPYLFWLKNNLIRW